MEPAVLYVDDEAPNLDVFRRCLDEQFRVLTAPSGPAALELLRTEDVGVLISDQKMDPMSGIELLALAQARHPLVTRMLLTAFSDRELLLAASQRGKVDDYLLKPWQADELALRLRQGLELHARRVANASAAAERDVLKEALKDELYERRDPLIGLDRGLAALGELLGRIAPTDSTVMLRGESGTGKELVAREIHRRSSRAGGPFIRTNCSAFAEQLLESELFGHEKGAFTGADRMRVGRFEQAQGGTIFLDEIGDVSPAIQLKLLNVLQERELQRLGGTATIRVNIRIIAATHRNLEERMNEGAFRKDLFYRLNVVPLLLPPLRERPGDVEALAIHFAERFSRELGKSVRLSPGALAALQAYDWPGNVRELRNVLERAAVLADPQMLLEAGDLSFDMVGVPLATATHTAPPPPTDRSSTFKLIEEEKAARIAAALRQAGGSVARAARLLNMKRTTLGDQIRKLGIT